MKAATVLVYLYLLLRNSLRNPRKCVQNELEVNPLEFLDEFFIPKTRVLVLSVGEDFVILACVVFTQCQRVTDRWTDRRLSDHS